MKKEFLLKNNQNYKVKGKKIRFWICAPYKVCVDPNKKAELEEVINAIVFGNYEETIKETSVSDEDQKHILNDLKSDIKSELDSLKEFTNKFIQKKDPYFADDIMFAIETCKTYAKDFNNPAAKISSENLLNQMKNYKNVDSFIVKCVDSLLATFNEIQKIIEKDGK